MLVLEYGSASDKGSRPVNEDAALTIPGFFVVADGLGGHAAGDVASGLAVARLGLLASRDDVHSDDVLAAIGEANSAILAASADHDDRAGMGTTVAGLGIVRVGGGEHWIVFNVGDSRVYRFADGRLAQVSIDHSEIEELLATGRLTAEQARGHPLSNIVTRSLGTDPAPSPDLWLFPPVQGERFLLCSDGLTAEIDDDAIAGILTEEPRAQEAADRLVREAVLAGGRDNVTAIVIHLVTVHGGEVADERTAPRVRTSEAG